MAWVEKYRLEFDDDRLIPWKISFYEDGFPGSVTIITGTGEPLKFEFLNESDEVFDTIKESQAIISLLVNSTNFSLIDLYSVEDMHFKVDIYQNEVLYWTGYVDPKQYEESYDDLPYETSVTCVDGLTLLKNILYDDSGTYYNGRRFESQVILDILGKIGFTTFREYVNLYETAMDSTEDDSPMDQLKIDVDIFQDMYCDEVLRRVLEKYNACIRQKDGVFCIYRPTELAITDEGLTDTAQFYLHANADEPDYYHYGFMDRNPLTKKWVSIQRLGNSHNGNEGKVMISRSDDGITWTEDADAIVNTAYDDRNISGGYNSAGRLFVFFGIYDYSITTWISIAYVYSDDDGKTWSSSSQILVFGAGEAGGTHGRIIELNNGTLLMGGHFLLGGVYSVGYFKSIDDGLNWTQHDIKTTAGVYTYAEPSFLYLGIDNYLGESEILVVCRKTLVGANTCFHQFYSQDGGDTWGDFGDTTFETWGVTVGNERPPFLALLNYFGTKIVACYYVVTDTQKFRVVYGLANNAYTLGVDMWIASTITDVMNVYEYPGGGDYTRDGYQSVYHFKNRWQGIGQIYLESIINQSDISYFKTTLSNRLLVLSELGVGELLTSWANVSFDDTFTSSGKNITSAIDTGLADHWALSNTMALQSGDTLVFRYTLTKVSGSVPYLAFVGPVTIETPFNPMLEGTNTVTFSITTAGTYRFWIYALTTAVNFSLTASLILKYAHVPGRIFTDATTKTSTRFWPWQYINRTTHSSAIHQTPGGVMLIQGPAKKVTVTQDYNYKDSWIDNWEFKSDTYDIDTDAFDSWTDTGGALPVPAGYLLPGETKGVALIPKNNYPVLTHFIYQDFGVYSVVGAADIIVFEFEYLLANRTVTKVNVNDITIYMQIVSPTTTYYLHVLNTGEYEWSSTPGDELIEVVADSIYGNFDWVSFKRTVVGIPETGTYTIHIYCIDDTFPTSQVDLCIRNLKFYASSYKIELLPLLVPARKFSWKKGFYMGTKTILQPTKVLKESTKIKKYEATNPINGEEISFDYILGDIDDVDLDNIIEQFAGALASYVSAAIDFTVTWNSNYGSEAKPLLELIGDEIAEQYSRPKQFIDFTFLETNEVVSDVNLLGNLQDDLNRITFNRIFVFNRGTFDVRNRNWKVDLVEIIE